MSCSISKILRISISARAIASRFGKCTLLASLVCNAEHDHYLYFNVSEGRLLLADGYLKVIKS